MSVAGERHTDHKRPFQDRPNLLACQHHRSQFAAGQSSAAPCRAATEVGRIVHPRSARRHAASSDRRLAQECLRNAQPFPEVPREA